MLCQPFGREAMWVHKGWRVLAENLAAAGSPTLRFDYAGTGDSAGESEDFGEGKEQLERWLQSIRAAVAFLKQTTGVTEVALCGLRLGATLAAMVAADEDISELVLLAPVSSGRQYLRELRLLQQNWLETGGIYVEATPADVGYAEAVGHRLVVSSVAVLSKFDLLRDAHLAERPPRRLLVLDSYDPVRAKKLVDACSAAGADASFDRFDECSAFMQESGVTETPHAAIARIVEWLGTPSVAAASVAKDIPAALLIDDGVRETPVIFDNGRLFGILCEPIATTASRRSVIFVNPGATHRIGDARISVTLARRLAREGTTSLRFDVGALGDSATPVDERPVSMLFMRRSCDDVAAAAAFLAARGLDDVSCFGVCSGAYLCLHAATVSPYIRSLTLVNTPKFNSPEDPFPLVGNENRPRTATSTFIRSFVNAHKWKRVLRGQRDVAPIARELVRRMGTRFSASVAYLAERTVGVNSVGSRVRAMVRGLGERGVKVRFIYGNADVGLEEFAVFFGAGGRRMRNWRNVETKHCETLDHACFSYPAREQLMASFAEFVRDEPPRSGRERRRSRIRSFLRSFNAPVERTKDRHAEVLEPRQAQRM
ncbi:alpha/beta hydrolase [Burkholderia sp. Leaf177]|uniref:alpha/beta hydrolase n=1 Tax=Burkholderia sp. Leaf177 TaxID=1736287 RepID=UPI0012E3B21B|nr:alpha/beta hydrolase [Burkholderia sp. Leaf177]